MAAIATQHPLVAHKTVLVLLPPREFAHRINPFRRVHDKSALRWTAHITLTFPFVEANFLPETVASLRGIVKDIQPFKLRLDKVESFSMSGYDTVHLTIAQQEDQRDVQRLWKTLANALGYRGRPFKPHMTLGQAPNRNNLESLQFLNAKAQRVLLSVKELDWTVGQYQYNMIIAASSDAIASRTRQRSRFEEGRVGRWNYEVL
jgi:2'-5' RNA ligase